MHPLIALSTGTRWVSGAREADFGLDPERAAAVIAAERPDVVFLTSPNNPTGTALPSAGHPARLRGRPGHRGGGRGLRRVRPGRLRPARWPCCPEFPRLVVTRTMSKAFALAGARVGYLAADPAVIQALLLVRLPYHLSA